MRKKGIVHWLPLIPLALLCSSCNDQTSELDKLKSRMAADEQQLASLKSQLATQKAETDQRFQQVNGTLAELVAADSENQKKVNETTAKAPGIEETVATCVKYVRSLETQTQQYSQIYAPFDAFYNRGTGRVVNNNQFVNQSAVYAFNKCMASKGIPLS